MPVRLMHWVAPYLFFGQVLLPHYIHVWSDLKLGIRCFAPCAKEHQQKHRTVISENNYKTAQTYQIGYHFSFKSSSSLTKLHSITLLSLTYILNKNKQIHRERRRGSDVFFMKIQLWHHWCRDPGLCSSVYVHSQCQGSSAARLQPAEKKPRKFLFTISNTLEKSLNSQTTVYHLVLHLFQWHS